MPGGSRIFCANGGVFGSFVPSSIEVGDLASSSSAWFSASARLLYFGKGGKGRMIKTRAVAVQNIDLLNPLTSMKPVSSQLDLG